MSEPMAPAAKATLAHIVASIVDDVDAVEVTETDLGDRARLDVSVADGELGRVIGRRGRTAASIRTVTRAAAVIDDVDLDIEFVDD
ncbi:MAG: KH domain-containing protein [Ilumatobacter sp.]|nr:MAG: KH domain-containing protein [Ilumatobacter sp.]